MQIIIKELFIRCRKLNISLVFIFIYLIFLFQNIAINHSADIDCQDVMKIYREYTKEPYNFLTIDTSLPASDPLKFRKKLLILTYKNDNN